MMRKFLRSAMHVVAIVVGFGGLGQLLFPSDIMSRWDQLLSALILLSLACILVEYSPSSNDNRHRSDSSSDDDDGLPWPFLVILLVFVVGFAASGIHAAFKEDIDKRISSPSVKSLDAAVQTYLRSEALEFLADDIRPQPLTGKAIILGVASGSMHALYRDLPDGIRAQTADEIATVIYVESEAQRDGNIEIYSQKLTSAKRIWHVTMVAAAGELVVAYRRTFVGNTLSSYQELKLGFDDAGEPGVYAYNQSGSLGRVRGAEVLFGTSGGVETIDGRRVVRVVGPPPWDDALEWITDHRKWVEGMQPSQSTPATIIRYILWVLVFGGLVALGFYKDKEIISYLKLLIPEYRVAEKLNNEKKRKEEIIKQFRKSARPRKK